MTGRIKKCICVLMCAALLLGCLGTASADSKKKAADPDVDLFESWYYVTDTIPEGMASGYRRNYSWLYDRNYNNDERVVSLEVAFVSGDEALREAVKADSAEYSDGTTYYLTVDNDALKAPGTAVFRVTIESENLRWDNKYTLTVIDYNEYPIAEVTKTDLAIDAAIGDRFTEEEILSQVAVLHMDEIAKAIRFKNPKIKNWNQHFTGLDVSTDYSDTDENPEKTMEDREYTRTAVRFVYDSDPKTNESIETAVIKKYGRHPLRLDVRAGNIDLRIPFTVTAPGIAVETADKAVPGGKLQFKAVGTTDGMSFTWSSEGEGAAIDEKTGLMTIDAKAPMGSAFTVKATGDNGQEASAEVVLNDGAFADVEYPTVRSQDGFGVPLPDGWYNNSFDLYYGNGYVLQAEDYSSAAYRTMDGKVYLTGTKENSEILEEDPETARAYLETDCTIIENNDIKDIETEYIDLDGHPAILQTFTYYDEGAFYGHIGFISYPRNTRLLQIRAYSKPGSGQGPEDIPRVSIQDLKNFAHCIQYNPDEAPFTAADAELKVTAKDSPEAVTAGKGVQFTAAFANPDRVNQKNKNNTVEWSAVNADTGEAAEGITISNKGQLKVDRGLEAPVKIEVRAASVKYGNIAAYSLTAIPAAQKVEADPAELFFYVGTEAPQTVKAILTPDTVPLIGITWTPSKKDIVEITDTGDGTVSIKPLKAGKITVAVKEPGGKNARLNVSVVDPVETVELTVSGKAKPGGTVAVKAALAPKTAGNKNLEWSLDVGEDIATITEKGQVKISKEAPSGTKITVTCKALGAPEPITATAEIEIP